MTRRSISERNAPAGPALRMVLAGASRDVLRAKKLAERSSCGQIVGALLDGENTEQIEGIPVVGTVDGFVAGMPLPLNAPADKLLVVTGDFSRDQVRALLQACVRAGLILRFAKTAAGGLGMRPVVMSDLIGPPRGSVDWARVRRAIEGKRLLITGGGGSIGAELVRRILALDPGHLSVVDNSELNLFSITHDLEGARARSSMRFVDIRDGGAVRRAIEAERPDIVFHAAAMKHVPIVEMNPSEGVLTNVLGARNVIDAANDSGAHLIFVSTDKAANPASIMGATKRLMELYCQARDRAGGPRQLVARLGNVLGSAGSVAPLFDRQITRGGPVTITHPDVARFFITIRQAAEFLLDAAAVGLEAEEARGAALVLDMGEPLRIEELAHDMIRLKGLEPNRDVAVEFVGLRPGEKLREELIGHDESEMPTASPAVRAASSPAVTHADLSRRLDRLIGAARAGADDAVRAMVHELAAPAKVRVVS